MLISTPQSLDLFKRLLGDGSQFGLELVYKEQPEPNGLAQAFILGEDFIKGHPCSMILGDNLFYGHGLTPLLRTADAQEKGATIFTYHVANPGAYGVAGFDANHKVNSLEEKPLNPKSNFAVTGLYFYDENVAELAKTLKPSARGELEITDLNRLYLEQGLLRAFTFNRGIAWLDTGTHKSMLDASMFVEMIEVRQGLKIACLEEIAFRYGWIGREDVIRQMKFLGNGQYSEYLEKLLSPDDMPEGLAYPRE